MKTFAITYELDKNFDTKEIFNIMYNLGFSNKLNSNTYYGASIVNLINLKDKIDKNYPEFRDAIKYLKIFELDESTISDISSIINEQIFIDEINEHLRITKILENN